MARSSPDPQPVSLEQERERSIETLSRHFAHDALTLEELEQRIERVYRARDIPAVRAVLKDLPAEPPIPVVPAPRAGAIAPVAADAAHGRIVSVLGSSTRSGVWQPPQQLEVRCVLSDTHLDLTQAQLQPGVTVIHLRAALASVKVTIPPEVRMVCQVGAILASVEDHTLAPTGGTSSPVVRLTGSAVLSSVELFTRTREQISG